MKRILSIATILIVVISGFAISSAQPRRKKRNAVFIGGGAATGARHRQRKIIGGGLGTGARVRRGRYVTRNGKRIWVPQGSPSVVEREQLEAVRKKPSTNTNRP